ncbi:hypothetical protein PIROE2DRAFT_68641 [Piromyces sp. E2]|nr:hypothetical protein PIROE2DRAFT_68641 [Piromyces sp. E2]|eukprot:OUM68920.1 hypothetical protein PIROE2DRAFT_68641 [Piromyces sp. E2]
MMVRGYVLRNNYLIQCNGWSACTVSHVNAQGKDCTDAAEGTIMGNGKAICFYLYKDANNDEIYAEEKLPTTGTRYVMFEAAQANAVYGQNKGDVVVLSLTSDSVVVVSAGTGIARGFHQNIKVIGSLDNALIYCAQEGQLSSCGVVNGLNGFYLNYDSDRDTKEVIKCEEKLGCRKLPVTKTSCTAGDVGAVIKSGGKIMMCTTDAGGKVELGLSEANLNYLSVSPVNACFPGVIEENKSAVKVGADGSVTLLEPGVHLNEKVKGVVKNAIYTCTTKSVTTTCEVQDANLGYYKNAGTRHAEDTFIACSVNGCAGIAVDGQGECNANSVGKLIGASPSLCLLYNDDTGTEYNAALTGEDAVGYMVGYGVGNIFGIEENRYAFVNVNASSVQMSTEYQKYVYIKSDHLDEQGSSGCPAKEEELNEFMLEDDNIYGVYTLNCVDSQEKDNLCPGSESTTDTAGADE